MGGAWLLRGLAEVAVDRGSADAELVGDLLDGQFAGVVHLPCQVDLAGAELGLLTSSASAGAGGGFTTSVNISAPARLNSDGNSADVLIGLPSAGDFMAAG
jgi:hypothetical protein